MWKFNLLKDMKDREKQLFVDRRIVILEDKYPKAEVHLLVLPWKHISSLADVKQKDIKLLRHMDLKGREIAEQYGDWRFFKMGYHVEPSMERLHLHVISDDMNSVSLKRKRHWNKFTTPLFMDSRKVMFELEMYGRIQFPTKREIEYYMNCPLKCHKCSRIESNMDDLKNHLLDHIY